PNFKYIDPVLVNTLESDGIPYLYGSTGIIYRKDLYPNGIHSWKQFFDPKNPHQVSVLAEPKSAFSQALVALGADPVAPTEHEIRSAAKFLKHSTDADHIRFVTSDIELIQESILNGELGAAVIYSGDALSVIEENTHVAFVHPEEGFEIFMDCLLTVNGGSNPGLAHAFINYVLSPEIHARLAKELFYASPNSASLKLLETTAPEQLNNPAIYPSKALRAKGYPLKLNHSLVDRLGKILFNL
ncbi:MAG: extracellular solute-binding protein, partial [Verrucomicrobiota bacterium]